MVIQCDVDGVLNDLMTVAIRTFNDVYNKNYSVNDISTYDISNCLPKEDSLKIKEIFLDPTIWDFVIPLKDSQEGIKKLIQNQHEVYLVTNNDPHTFGDKYNWIKYYFPFIDDSHIVCMKNKWMLYCDIMIEDCLENLIYKPRYERILLDQPWNQFTKDDIYGIYRCFNWKEILETINKINNNLE